MKDEENVVCVLSGTSYTHKKNEVLLFVAA
jgi:hypothetical protein